MSKDEQPHRGGLVPVGDIPIDLPGVGRKLTARRQARHFTRLDQVIDVNGINPDGSDPHKGRGVMWHPPSVGATFRPPRALPRNGPDAGPTPFAHKLEHYL